jgi:ribonucleoside-diphosphate reductase alpha chain
MHDSQLTTIPDDPFDNELSRQIWQTRYRHQVGGVARDRCVEDSWRRVADAVASIEQRDGAAWARRFFDLLDGFGFLPGGRILAGAGAGAGTGLDVTLFNCFVMGRIEDSIDGIFDALKEAALTMQQGGGIGCDFSTLRPSGARAWRVGGVASGPVSFMHIWDSMCATLLSTAARRGAMMATLRCDHPDIELFIDAKREPRALRNFNLSVLVTDAFMQAVRDDRPWALVFPEAGLSPVDRHPGRARVRRHGLASESEQPCVVFKQLSARALWQRIMRSAYQTAEPGVLFIDRINRDNNLGWREHISATNPCGEIPLPPNGACNLGSLNLVRFVRRPFTRKARMDLDGLGAAAADAVRLLDNVIDLSRFPLPAQAEQARGTRRLGLGITGLADALILLGLDYRTAAARAVATEAMARICHAAYRASVALAAERGAFPWFDSEAYLARPFIRALPADIRDGIAANGIRNSHLTAIAPAGTISLFANNVSSGIEPVFAFSHRRRIKDADGNDGWSDVTDHALRRWRALNGDAPPPACFVAAADLQPGDHLAMQAALQPFVDNAISKTINVPERCDFASFRSIYDDAYRLGLKGCTVFRPNPVSGSVLADDAGAREPRTAARGQCCGLEPDD